jgi:acyl-coenzyme A synthetase/AMP-(fatty) acid ligase
MPLADPISLQHCIHASGNPEARLHVGPESSAAWAHLAAGSVIDCHASELRGRSVVLAVGSQLAAAAALIQLDGAARRIVLYPPDLSREHLDFVASAAAADAILFDAQDGASSSLSLSDCSSTSSNSTPSNHLQPATEWVLLTSGTTGRPKLVAHTLASLAGAIDHAPRSMHVWSTFYDIRRYGGLQIFLRSLANGTPLVLKTPEQTTAAFLHHAAAQGVTHILGTPSHWRGAFMSGASHAIDPQYVRLSGEIADQAILTRLRERYAQATIAHAFASTEAGVAFAVEDCQMGFPPAILDATPNVEMKIVTGTLRIRSHRSASRYLGEGAPPLRDSEGFVDTGDAIELLDGRYCFSGRLDGVINVGGQKVHPEEVESVLNRHPKVNSSLVRSKKNAITGSLVIADVVLDQSSQSFYDRDTLLREILQHCRGLLAAHKVPASINIVPSIEVSESGKLVRRHA